MSHLATRRVINTQFYELLTQAASPITLDDIKPALKVTTATEDDILQALIDSATEFGEKYTGRDFRVKTWRLLLDFFDCPIVLNRSQVDSITSIEYLKDGSFTTLSLDNVYLKFRRQEAEILLVSGASYPSDVDDRQQAIKIEFATRDPECLDSIKQALTRHVSNTFANRGDCGDDSGGCECGSGTATSSGATAIYDQIRISRL